MTFNLCYLATIHLSPFLKDIYLYTFNRDRPTERRDGIKRHAKVRQLYFKRLAKVYIHASHLLTIQGKKEDEKRSSTTMAQLLKKPLKLALVQLATGTSVHLPPPSLSLTPFPPFPP